MAALNHSTLRYDDHEQGSRLRVPPEAGTSCAGINRRQAMNMMTAIAAVPALGLPAVAQASAQPNRAEWDRAMANYVRATAESDAFELEYERILEARGTEIEKVPHVTMRVSGAGREYTTANRWDVTHARHSSRNLRYVEVCAYEDVKTEQLFVDAADKRDAKLALIDQRFDWDAVNDRYDAMSAAICETEQVLLEMPAPDGEALLWKVGRLYKPGEGIWSEDFEAQTHVDLHRFLSSGRA